jgi:hypothetical protein
MIRRVVEEIGGNEGRRDGRGGGYNAGRRQKMRHQRYNTPDKSPVN